MGIGRTRVVTAPDGRVWKVRFVRCRLPRRLAPGDVEEEDDLDSEPVAASVQLGLVPQLVVGLVRLARPAWEATIGRRPWILASAEDPPVTMVWRATGRRSAAAALDEIADALQRGDPRPQPFWAQWTGYDRGGIRLARKLG